MPPQNTSVGSRPTQRKVPMQVLALGYSRTGTLSLKIALETLGYVRTNHGFAVAFASPATMDMWIEAIKAKFHGEGIPYGRAEWDRLLGDCQAVSDVPHILFVEELIAAYPDAKVILTNRNVESWWKSYETTVAQARKPSFQVRLVSWLDPEHDGKREFLFQLIFKAMFNTEQLTVTEEKAKACFTAHYDEVRRLTSKDRLLEF
ncbi:hypothetical protein B0H17DRAFT_708548 [Mycena rosella]|uniref:P-loop containing nucleoside triphosphate hydrolase protein n=1 Tax=Mycena rosella TaxID=1033263 RepID=A0AAD7DBR4_MYCRO|nr:hypothetical protein B0H17DRAFT_708548 [Mycena rosella]